MNSSIKAFWYVKGISKLYVVKSFLKHLIFIHYVQELGLALYALSKSETRENVEEFH